MNTVLCVDPDADPKVIAKWMITYEQEYARLAAEAAAAAALPGVTSVSTGDPAGDALVARWDEYAPPTAEYRHRFIAEAQKLGYEFRPPVTRIPDSTHDYLRVLDRGASNRNAGFMNSATFQFSRARHLVPVGNKRRITVAGYAAIRFDSDASVDLALDVLRRYVETGR